jgi:hypothetical protein
MFSFFKANVEKASNLVISYVGWTGSLHEAVGRGDVDAVRKLLDEWVAVDTIDTVTKEPPLFLAIKKGHVEIARLLLQRGANPRLMVNFKTPLCVAITHYQYDMIDLLVDEFKVDVNQPIRNFIYHRNLAVNMVAEEMGSVVMMEHLERKGAAVSEYLKNENAGRDWVRNEVVLHPDSAEYLDKMLTFAFYKKEVDAFQHVDLDSPCYQHIKEKFPAIYLALNYNDMDQFPYVNKIPRLFKAIIDGDAEKTAVLLKHGANTNIKVNGCTVPMLIERLGSPDIVAIYEKRLARPFSR